MTKEALRAGLRLLVLGRKLLITLNLFSEGTVVSSKEGETGPRI
jgi:hypothetical protein